MTTFSQRIALLYWNGFRSMTVGRILWKIVLLKLVVFYVISKLFFPDYLQASFATDMERAAHVLENLTMGHAQTRPTGN